ncbi:UAA transporter [Thelephora terrestris]|uniref:UDP-galactose transporter homolog 1 n=1 Tax=Thelephora terrestris TaxID=56493 RepID=A0A9P6H3D0_9AGAM|nr:UAA transporter [Thelephora terrestris]
MALLRLGICVAGVYSMFLLWAIAQERLSAPFESNDGSAPAKFRSALMISDLQSLFSCISALAYLLVRRDPKHSFKQTLGLVPPPHLHDNPQQNGSHANGTTNIHEEHHRQKHKHEHKTKAQKLVEHGIPLAAAKGYAKALLWQYFQCAVIITAASPFGFAALAYISYPAMVLAKSCKLVPVMLMNVLLYRRKFAPYKYLVVALVTLGITSFMFFGNEKKGHKGAGKASSGGWMQLIGMGYLLANLLLDGVVNSTQDQIFQTFKPTGQQMMLHINLFSTLISSVLSVLPLPHIPVIHPTDAGELELLYAVNFLKTHPDALKALVQFAITGALGQLFIFETLQHFGSLTLVTITLTRKLFTMLLSVVVYNHTLTAGQWIGTGIVFAGISVEAWVKRKDVHAKRVAQEKEKAKIKEL